MTTMRYSVSQPPIDTIFAWIKSGEIAIPEIQRPFVWDNTKVRDLLDSLYRGYPVGYLIAWKNPNVKLKDGTTSDGKRILIDGQQRVTALMSALLGKEIVNKAYQQLRITIAFHPIDLRFEVSNPAIAADGAWIPDVGKLFDPETKLLKVVNTYCERNPQVSADDVHQALDNLKGITHNQIGLIELAPDLDIETVTDIFIRVNSAGVALSQADFAMSKIAVNTKNGGTMLRKAIDYFCHLAATPEAYKIIKNDKDFHDTDYATKMAWLAKDTDDLYNPSYTDMLRVAFTSEFSRGRLEDLVALLSGRNFTTKLYEEAIVESSFASLRNGVLRFMNEDNFKNFILIIRSAGFVDESMVGSQNTLNFAYVLYLTLRDKGMPKSEIQKQVRRWFVMTILTGRYSGSAESTFDLDIRQINEQGIERYAQQIYDGQLSEAFWSTTLPQSLETSVASSPFFRLYQAAQIKQDDHGFLSRDIKVRELVEVKSDVHHVFPKHLLKKAGMTRGQYNQIANYAVTPSEINIAIGSKEPKVYVKQLLEQCEGGKQRYGNITTLEDLRRNFQMNCIREDIVDMTIDDYKGFLAERRKLMARKIQAYFGSL